MKKKLVLSLFLLCAAVGVQAQTKMVIHQKTGEDIEILFADKPVATFEGDEMVLTTTKTTVRFAISNLETTDYEEDSGTTSIESITQLSPEAGPSRIYDLDGRLLRTVPAGSPVNFDSLPQGTFIIKNNKTSYKVNRK